MSGKEGHYSKDEESSSSMDGRIKRGREGEEVEEEAFKKSRRTTRSPPKTHKKDEKLDSVLVMLRELKVEIAGIKKRQEEGNAEIGAVNRELTELRKEQEGYREEMAAVRRENESLKRQYETARKENEEIKDELNSVRKSIDSFEREKREKNIVISGLNLKAESNPQEIMKKVDDIIGQSLGVKVPIKYVQRLGPRTCLVKMDSMDDKEEIMKNKQKLRHLKDERIYINHDLTVKERDMQREIRSRAQAERKAGKSVKVGFSKITIEGEVWRWSKDTNKLERAKN